MASNVFPVAIIIFSVIGLMLLGIATPEESAACGAIATLAVSALKRSLNLLVIRKTVFGTLRITGIIFLIMAGAKGFSQVLAFTGATEAMAEGVLKLPVHPLIIMTIMQAVMIFLGCFMDTMATILITMPTFIPAIVALGFDPIWFGSIAVVNLELGMITPPFGIVLYAMKAVAPDHYKMSDIIKSVLPFMGLQIVAMDCAFSSRPLPYGFPGNKSVSEKDLEAFQLVCSFRTRVSISFSLLVKPFKRGQDETSRGFERFLLRV